jgi:UDP-N-acetylmuramyl pentapeptide synthase
MFEGLLVLGVLIGSLSPLLTFARLFQMKEWRLDRLGEHLRREGWIRSLGGPIRAALIVLYAAFLAYGAYAVVRTSGGGPSFIIVIGFLPLLPWLLGIPVAMTIGQVALNKQRLPIWTAKSLLIVFTAVLINVVIAWWCMFQIRVFLTPLIPLLQPLVVCMAWLLWRPVDTLMKNRLLSKATARRATLKDATVIGIVGSVGKTTTKELLKCVLQDLHPIATPDHVNTELGVASWLLKTITQDDVRAWRAAPQQAIPLLIVEMGAYRKGEIATLCRVAQPTIGVVTALGSDHLALFGSEEAIVDANAEILHALPKDGHAFFLSDNSASTGLKDRAPCAVTLAGSADATVIHTDRGLTLESDGTRFAVALHGAHNAGNAMLAVAVARHMGIADERIRELLAGYRGSAHTFHLKKERGILVMDDTYNVSPLSFKAALDWAKDRDERPRVLLTSGLLETGADEKRFLKELGAAANKSAERVVFTTEAGRSAFAEGLGKDVELLSPSTPPVDDDGLLLCVGRMPQATLRRLLPRER